MNMCAISGILVSDPFPSLEVRLRNANEAGRHRGPDDHGLCLVDAEGHVVEHRGGDEPAVEVTPGAASWRLGLAHRRLSILDLSSTGHQPMSFSNGCHWMVFNGEIYNYIELRDELSRLGVEFRSRSDTEVILAAYAAWGASCLERFNGMWAFALYDRERRVLFCARDRFGVKPFLYQITRGRFVFASELKQMRFLCEGNWQADPRVLGDFFLWKLQNHTEDTAVRGVQNLPPSHFLEVTDADLVAGRVIPRRYWEPRPAEPMDDQQAAERFRDLLADAVRLRLRSDVPVGVSLSGGLDSSAVACLAALARRDETPDPLLTFTATYPDRGCSEEPFARLVAQRAGARHILIQPASTDLRQDWSRYTTAIEQPFPTLSFYSAWKVYQGIREQGIKVVLTGQGGDELLLGYQRYRPPVISLAFRRGHWLRAWREFWRARGHGGFTTVNLLMYLGYFSFPSVRSWRRCRVVGPFLQPHFLTAARAHDDHLVRSLIHRDRQDLQTKEYLHYGLPHLLQNDDRVASSHAVETRLPFLDYRLFEHVLGQADRMLVRDGWSKWILREALSGVLPDEVRMRKDKMGFETPTGRLFQDNKVFFQDLLRRHLGDPLVRVPHVLQAYMNSTIEETLLCSVCSYLTWKEQFQINE